MPKKRKYRCENHPLYNPVCRKNSYPTWEMANEKRTKTVQIKPKLELFIYQCPACKLFHLTKQKQAVQNGFAEVQPLDANLSS